MKILVFEWLTGGGHWIDSAAEESTNSIQFQGLQMAKSVAADFLEAGIKVALPIDVRVSHRIPDQVGLEKLTQSRSGCLSAKLAGYADEVDHIVVIAPETRSCLLNCLDWLQPWKRKLISPDIEFVRITSCKQTTFDYLKANQFDAFPQGINLSEFRSDQEGNLELPLVVKPTDGAGSDEVQLITDWQASKPTLTKAPQHYRLERFISGMSVSVSALCGPGHHQMLPPTQQLFDREPFGNYVGSSYPIRPDLAERATQLAVRAMNAMPQTTGYVGLDLVLSDRPGQQDCLIEINPRLTMSYLKLREIYSGNLAQRMLEIATGR